MARKANYDQKIADLQNKIEKKQAEIKALRAEYNNLKSQQSEEAKKAVLEEMAARNISVEQLLEAMRNMQPQQ